MPNLCYIAFILIYLVWFGFTDNYQWPMPNSYYIWSKWWTNSRLTFQFCDLIIKSFFKDILNGRIGWSRKGPKIIVAGSLQLDIWQFITIIFTVLTFYDWCWFVIYPFKLFFISSWLQISCRVFFRSFSFSLLSILLASFFVFFLSWHSSLYSTPWYVVFCGYFCLRFLVDNAVPDSHQE